MSFLNYYRKLYNIKFCIKTGMVPAVMKSLNRFEDPDKMSIEHGDQIVIIDGRPEHYWWKGQNQRTFQVAMFPRCLVDPMRRKQVEDISKPLENSFIHTGHGEPFGKSWGSPIFIDDTYLRNPLDPPDVAGTDYRKKPLFNSKKQFNYTKFTNDSQGSPKSTLNNRRPNGSKEATLIDLVKSPDDPKVVPIFPATRRVENILDEPIDPRTYANVAAASSSAPDPFDTSTVFSHPSRYYSQVTPDLYLKQQQYSNIDSHEMSATAEAQVRRAPVEAVNEVVAGSSNDHHYR